MGIEDVYTAFCFDEACSYIIQRLEDGEEIRFTREVKSFSEMYAGYN